MTYLLKRALRYATNQNFIQTCPVACAGVIATLHMWRVDARLILSASIMVGNANIAAFVAFP